MKNMLERVYITKMIINFGCCKLERHATLGFAFGLVEQKQRKPMAVDITITNEQKIKVTLTPMTATGKPAPIDGKPEWTVVSGESTLQVAEDGKSAYLISSDTPGDTQILVEADADIGEGKETISDVIRLTVAGARAANLGLIASPPEAK